MSLNTQEQAEGANERESGIFALAVGVVVSLAIIGWQLF